MTALDPTHAIADAWHSGHLIGAFELRGAVSRSDSGIVYRAWDHGLAIAVAIKEHLPTPIARRLANGDVVREPLNAGTAYDRSLQAFIDNTHALAHCDHPALVRVLHLQAAHGTAYRVMPWIAGDRLRERRHSMSRPPDEPALRALVDDLLGALEVVHRTGIAHGGVHPSKILVRPGERALLLGPRAVSADAGGAPGPWTDLRAVADVARFCISGVPPTADGQAVEPMAKILERLLFDGGALHYGQDFMRVLDAAASPDVALRPQSVAEFRELLRQAARADAGPSAADRQTPADAPPLESRKAVSDAASARLIERVFEAIPSRIPAEPWSPRADPRSAPIEPPRRPASERSIGETNLRPMHTSAVKRHRSAVAARVFATLLALAGLGAWQWLYKPAATDFAVVVSEVGAPAPSMVSSPAETIAAPPRQAVSPVIESAAPPAANEAAALRKATRVEPMSVPVEQAAARPAPAQSPREACGDRKQFALYYCMQHQCERNAWTNHPQCVLFRATDQIG